MPQANAPKPNSEAVSLDNSQKTEYQFYDENSQPIFKTKLIHKGKNIIEIFPFSYSKINGVSPQKISIIEFRGWEKLNDLPGDFRSGKKIRLNAGRLKLLMSFIKRKFPEVTKLVISKNDASRFSRKSITYNWNDMRQVLNAIKREKDSYSLRNRLVINNEISQISSKLSKEVAPLPRGGVQGFFSLYDLQSSLSDEDVKTLLPLVTTASQTNISIIDNFIETRDKINVAYLEDVIKKYKQLLAVRNDNEKEWQKFFETHGWILNNLFPFQVILHDREAYVGGKTIHNAEGRVVDFLFTNGFKDNYALLEIKTHRKSLLKGTTYRDPDVFAMHEDLSGAISQCVDQKNTFLTEMGQKYKILDPKVILIIGKKTDLDENQKKCFELLRSNQKNVEIVAFDELLQKIEALMSILRK